MSRHAARALLVVLILPGLATAGDPFRVPPPGTPAPAAPLARPTDGGRPPPTADDLDKLVARYPQADFDPAAKAAALGDGVAPPLAFVRDGVRFESYPGVLRGAAGALAARAANAADRSLLLAALLSAKKVPVRFAFGTLGDDAAAKLVDRVFAPVEAGKGPSDTPFAARVAARAGRDFAAVAAALGDRLPTAAAVTRADLLAEVRPHVWVQANVDGAWTDLDPAFADAAPGKRYCDVDRTADALPADRYQQVTVRVVVEQLDGGRLVESTALEHARPAAELGDAQVFLVHHGAEGLKGLGNAVGATGAADTLAPILWVDGTATAGKPVDFAAGAAAAPGKKGGMGDVLDALGGDPPPAAAAAGPTFVAEYLDVDVARPGAAPVHHRRVLADRAGPAWRAAAAHDAATLRPLARDGGGLVDPRSVHNLSVGTGGHDMWSYAMALRSLAEGNGPTAETTDFARQVWPIAVGNLATAMWADRVVLPALNGDATTARFCLDAPRLTLFTLTPGPDGVGSQMDLMHDAVRGVAADAAAAPAVARGKLWYGVAAGAMEHEWMAEQGYGVEADPRITSTSSLLTDAAGQMAVVDARTDVSTAPPETAARLRAAVAGGQVLAVPATVLHGGETGWWAVAPNGDVRPVGGDDLGMGVYRPSPGATQTRYNNGGYSKQSAGPGRSYNIDPNRPKGGGGGRGGKMQPKSKGGGGGELGEYAEILMDISIPNWAAYINIGLAVAAAAEGVWVFTRNE